MRKHTHKYQRTDISKTPHKEYIVYRCVLPDCNHYIVPELLIGKRSLCHRCDEEFVITSDLARLAKPHCKECGPKNRKQLVDDELVDFLLGDVE